MTSRVPVTSLENIQAYLVAYDYDTNTNFATPCPEFKHDTAIAAFEEVFNKFRTNEYTPAFNVTDTQATSPIKSFFRTQGFK